MADKNRKMLNFPDTVTESKVKQLGFICPWISKAKDKFNVGR